MEKAKKYIERFFKTHKQNTLYTMRLHEIFEFKTAIKGDNFDAVIDLFDYGYVKGYRAALSEMKKGGVA